MVNSIEKCSIVFWKHLDSLELETCKNLENSKKVMNWSYVELTQNFDF
jgi:hypothetical protein